MHSVEHTLKLKDGRLLAYHTFPNAEEEDEDEDEEVKVKADKDTEEQEEEEEEKEEEQKRQRHPHPVLYFHGYPSCGLEGGVTSARSVARAGGKLYAIDRPGMGNISSPYANSNSNTNSNNLDTFVENVWELVDDQGWNEFSILGVSGGGPYILAVLASYLQRMEMQRKQQDQQHQSSDSKNNNNNKTKSRPLPILLPRLRNVCLVCAVCMSAAGSSGESDGFLESGLESMNTLVETASTSRISRFWIHTFALTQGILNHYIIPILPISWVSKMMTANNVADQQWMNDNDGKNNKYLSTYLVARKSMAVQGYPGIYDDTLIVVRAHHSHEDIIRKYYSNKKNDDDDDGDDNDNDLLLLPAVGIFQGTSDSNVPLSHAEYMHTSIFHGEHKNTRSTCKLILYKDLGHISTIATKSDDFAAFVTSIK